MSARALRGPHVTRRAALAALAAVAFAGCGAREPVAVFSVRVPTAPSRPDDVATAFAAGDGRVVTVAHVLAPGRPVFVDGRRARVVRLDRRLDLAVLEAGAPGEAPAPGTPRAGQPVTVRVARGTLHLTVRRTITAHLDGSARPALELAGAVEPGDSGAPVLDAGGRLLGVVFAQSSHAARVYALDARALP